VNSGELLISEL